MPFGWKYGRGTSYLCPLVAVLSGLVTVITP
jgi:hypothetical protein